jgi:ribonuclease Z
MGFYVRILGSSSATPTASRHPSAQLLNVNERLFLIDCGEGTQMQLRRYKIKTHRIKHIFISHLHGDHFLGLPGLIFTMHLFGRKDALHIYGNPVLKTILDLLTEVSETTLQYPLIFHPLLPGEAGMIYQDDATEVTAFPLLHRVPTHGFLFKERFIGRRIRKEAIAELNISSAHFNALKEGKDLLLPNGDLIPNHQLTCDPKQPRAYGYCSDTGYTTDFLPFIKGVDTLYHEATFMKDKEINAREKMHSTTHDAASMAIQAGAKKLIIGHYSARYDDLGPVLAEAKAIFQETYLAEEGLLFQI